MFKTYSEKLKDPRWQKKRLEIFQRDDFTCTFCKSKHIELQVHHKEYEYGKEPWEYENDELETLCKECHYLFTYVSLDHYNAVCATIKRKFDNEGFEVVKKGVNNG
jgi:hypothetical protein